MESAPTHIPSDLKTTLPHPETPWKISKEVFGRLQKTDQIEGSYRKVKLLPSDPEAQFVLKYFQQDPPSGVGIKAIYCVHSGAQTELFEKKIPTLNKKKIDYRWDNKHKKDFKTLEKDKDLRIQVMKRWKKFGSYFSPINVPNRVENDFPNVTVLPLWSGVSGGRGAGKFKESARRAHSICTSGFETVGSYTAEDAEVNGEVTDSGYFGNGIYFTNSAKYASKYAHGNLMLTWVVVTEPFPVAGQDLFVENGKRKGFLMGKGHYRRYDSHFAPVKPITKDGMDCYPLKKGEQLRWDELVVFQTSQTLCRFWIELEDGLPLSPFLTPKAVSISFFDKTFGSQERALFIKTYNSAKEGNPNSQYALGKYYLFGKSSIAQDKENAIAWFYQAASQEDVADEYAESVYKSQHALALHYAQMKNSEQAVEYFQKAADQGYAPSQHALGFLYQSGWGVEGDTNLAKEYYTKAASQGHTPSKQALKRLDSNCSPDEVESWLSQPIISRKAKADQLTDHKISSCSSYFTKITINVSQLSAEGLKKLISKLPPHLTHFTLLDCLALNDELFQELLPKLRYVETLNLSRNLLQDPDFSSCKYLSHLTIKHSQMLKSLTFSHSPYILEVEDCDNLPLQKEWFLDAATDGVASAQWGLGAFYIKDKDSKNPEEAVKWYRKAIAQDYALGYHELAWCYLDEKGVEKDEKQAVELYLKAARKGFAGAQCNLGFCYANGRGVSQSDSEAVLWYRKSADQGHAIAQFYLGLCYENGRGVDQSWSEAVSWYRKAAAQDDAAAQCSLGWCYENGWGVTKNKSEAFSWYYEAAGQRHEGAQSQLAKLTEYY